MKKHIFDIISIILFIIWGVIEIFSFFPNFFLIINLCYAFLLIILFELSIKNTDEINRKNRYNSIKQSIYVIISIVISPTIILYLNGRPTDLNALIIVNVGVSTQSILYLIKLRKNKHSNSSEG